MRWIMASVLALAIAFTFTSAAQASPKGKKGLGNSSTVNGTVVGYKEHNSSKKLVVNVTADDGTTSEKTIKVDDNTKVTLDGNTIAISALRAGEKVTINLTKKLATQVTATSN